MNPRKAVILLSGGLDSATVLAVAKSQGYACYALTVNYGQRHQVEMRAAQRIATESRVVEHKLIHIDLNHIGGSALTDEHLAVPTAGVQTDQIPITYVPARNTIFLSIALGWAEVLAAHHIFIGVNAVDYSGYPDCRPAFITAFEQMANLATKAGVNGQYFQIHTPLIALSKMQIIQLGKQLGVPFAVTISCYQPDQKGHACGICDACRLRAAGFTAANVVDPTVYQTQPVEELI